MHEPETSQEKIGWWWVEIRNRLWLSKEE